MKINILLPLAMILLVGTVLGAQCTNRISDSGISCGVVNPNCEFGVGDELNNIEVYYRSSVDNQAKVIRVLLCKTKDCLGSDRLDGPEEVLATTSGDKFSINIDCPPSGSEVCLDATDITKGGTYYIQGFIDPNGDNTLILGNISLKKSLMVLLNCGFETKYINREVVCEYDVEDSDTGSLVSGYTSTVYINNQQIVNPSGYVKFTPTTVGSVLVKLEVEKVGYVKATIEEIIEIDDPVNDETLLIDGKTVSSYGSDGISKGTHRLEFVVEKSGEPLEINNIKAKITNPSNLETILDFVKKDDNKFETSYNFEQPGYVYTLKGTINPEDLSETPILFEYSIPIASEVTTPYKNSLVWIIVGVVLGFFVFLTIIGIIMRIAIKK